MGVKGLWKVVEKASESSSLRMLSIKEGFEGKRPERLYVIGVDVSIWMQQMLHAFSVGHAQSGENPELRTLFYRLATLAQQPIHAIFVTDGPHRPAVKRGKQVKTSPLWLSDGLRLLVDAFGFGWIEAAGEAEAELAHMNRLGVVDAVMTDDSDTLVFGASVVIRNPSFKRSALDEVQIYCASTIRRKLMLGQDDLLLYALLVGCDYDQGLPNCGVRTAQGLVQYGLGRTLRHALNTLSGKDLDMFLDRWRDTLGDDLRNDPRQYIGRKSTHLASQITSRFPNVSVAQQFLTPTLLTEDSYKPVLRPHSINFAQIGSLCELYFSWGNRTEILKTVRTALWSDEVVRMLVCEGLQREGVKSMLGSPRHLLRVEVDAVDPPRKFDYATCLVRITNDGVHQAVEGGLRQLRQYRASAKHSEEYNLREAALPLIIRLPSVIVEYARPEVIRALLAAQDESRPRRRKKTRASATLSVDLLVPSTSSSNVDSHVPSAATSSVNSLVLSATTSSVDLLVPSATTSSVDSLVLSSIDPLVPSATTSDVDMLTTSVATSNVGSLLRSVATSNIDQPGISGVVIHPTLVTANAQDVIDLTMDSDEDVHCLSHVPSDVIDLTLD